MSETAQCPICVHYRFDLKCAAFPDGLPAEILTGQHDHRDPYSGDNGVRFERIESPVDADQF